MKPLLVTLLGSVLLACLLTPPLYSLFLEIWPDFPWPYARVLNRVFLLLLVIFLVRYRREFQLQRLSLALATPAGRGTRTRHVILGILASAIPVACVVPFLVGDGVLIESSRGPVELFGKFLKVLPAALLVGFLEESFFRVLFFAGLAARWGIFRAFFLTNIVYAVVHFITPDRSFEYTGYSLTVGFEYLGALSSRLLLPGVGEGVMALFVVGAILTVALIRGRSLYLAIGLHAGWILGMKMVSYCYELSDGISPAPGLGSRYFLLGEGWTWVSFVLTAAIIAALSEVCRIDSTPAGKANPGINHPAAG